MGHKNDTDSETGSEADEKQAAPVPLSTTTGPFNLTQDQDPAWRGRHTALFLAMGFICPLLEVVLAIWIAVGNNGLVAYVYVPTMIALLVEALYIGACVSIIQWTEWGNSHNIDLGWPLSGLWCASMMAEAMFFYGSFNTNGTITTGLIAQVVLAAVEAIVTLCFGILCWMHHCLSLIDTPSEKKARRKGKKYSRKFHQKDRSRKKSHHRYNSLAKYAHVEDSQ